MSLMKVIFTMMCLVLCIGDTISMEIKGSKSSKTVTLPDGCVYKHLNNIKEIICDELPDIEMPLDITYLKVKKCPVNLTRKHLLPMKPTKITTFDFCDAGVEYIEDGAFEVFPELKVLKLSNNQIKHIGAKAFEGCNKIKEIYLDGNGLATLGSNCFSKLNTLESLYIQRNKLTAMPLLPPSIEKLDFSDNQIADISTYKFQKNLQELDLCHNPINIVPAATLTNAENLNSLCAPSISEISPTVLLSIRNITLEAHNVGVPLPADIEEQITRMDNLYTLTIIAYQLSSFKFIPKSLKELRLEQVTTTADQDKQFLAMISSLVELKVLDLTESSQLAKILVEDSFVWADLPKLGFLGLRNCGLTSFGHIQSKENTIFLEISMNPLHCDCAVAKKFYDSKIKLVGDLNQTSCDTPQEYHGMAPLAVLQSCIKDYPPITAEGRGNEGIDEGLDSKVDQIHSGSSGEEHTETQSHEHHNTSGDASNGPGFVDGDETHGFNNKNELTKPTEKKTHIIVGVVVAVAVVAAVIFAALFFHFRRRGHAGIDDGNASFRKQTTSRDNLISSQKK